MQHVGITPHLPLRLIKVEPARHDQYDIRRQCTQLRPFQAIGGPPRGPRHKISTRRGDQLGYPMAGNVWWIEPFERENARPRPPGDSRAHRSNSALHLSDALFGLLHGVRRAADVPDAGEDGGEIVGVQPQDRSEERRVGKECRL